jgi:hypothetical protein
MLNKVPTDRRELCMDPHGEFLELCALSTSGELTVEEQERLAKHLRACADCREAIQQFEAVVDRAVPALSPSLHDRNAPASPGGRRHSGSAIVRASTGDPEPKRLYLRALRSSFYFCPDDMQLTEAR